MKLPILAFCDGWLHVYESVEDAEIGMEPIDVENGEWEAFDASGQVMELSVRKQGTRGVWRLFSRFEEVVQIGEFTPSRIDRERLRALILGYVNRLSQADQKELNVSPRMAEQLPFDELVERARQEFVSLLSHY